ncbi:MAG: NPCBM/NEW2 domain-containing protein [Planctomycetota bacterium]
MFLILIALGTFSALPAPLPVQVRLADGSSEWTTLEVIDAAGVTVTGKRIAAQLLSAIELRPASPTEPQQFVELIDGSRIAFTSVTMNDRRLLLESDALAAQTTLRASSAKLLVLAERDQVRQSFQEDWAGDPPADLLFLRTKDGAVDAIDGVADAITPETIAFRWDEQPLQVKRTKAAALALYGRKENAADPACSITTTDGSVLMASSIDWRQEAVSVVLAARTTLRLRPGSIASVTYALDRDTYLSDLKPLRSEWTPLVGLPADAVIALAAGQPRVDVDYQGRPIATLDDGGQPVEHAKGLAVRSRTELVYQVPKEAARFRAVLGLDPETRHIGNVSVTVTADDTVLWSGAIDGETPPVELNEPLGNARTLTLEVGYGENLDFGDRLHLGNARFTE